MWPLSVRRFWSSHGRRNRQGSGGPRRSGRTQDRFGRWRSVVCGALQEGRRSGGPPPRCVDILVHNAAHQASFADLADIADEEWCPTFDVNISPCSISQAAVPPCRRGALMINTASVNSNMPNPTLLATPRQMAPCSYRQRSGPDAGREGHPAERRRVQGRPGRRSFL